MLLCTCGTCRADVLMDKVHIQWHISSVAQVIFSTSCSHYVGPHEKLTPAQFIELLEKSGGSQGHAKLYLLPYKQLNQTQILPDTTCFTPLSEFPRSSLHSMFLFRIFSFPQSTLWMMKLPLSI